MWQVNAVSTAGKVLLRPHANVGGRFSNIAEIDLAPLITPANATQQHHIRIRADGQHDHDVDRRDPGRHPDRHRHPSKGTIGFRRSVTNGVAEIADYDNLVVRGLDGTVLFSDDFSIAPDPAFPQAPVVNGQLEPNDGVTLLSREAEAPVLRHDFALEKPIASARAYVYGLGLAELHLNGQKAGDRALAPTNSQYAQRSLYDTYDVTSQLRRARTRSASGSATATTRTTASTRSATSGAKKAIMLLRVTFADGTRA